MKANNHSGTTGPVTLGDHMPSQFVSAGGSTTPKREPLLPTPPSTQMVKLDTNLTCEYTWVGVRHASTHGWGLDMRVHMGGG